jgi:hypothetical protein
VSAQDYAEHHSYDGDFDDLPNRRREPRRGRDFPRAALVLGPGRNYEWTEADDGWWWAYLQVAGVNKFERRPELDASSLMMLHDVQSRLLTTEIE